MESLELVVAVAAAVLVAGFLARRSGLSEPLLLLGAGCSIGLTPYFADVTLSPEVVLLLFFPALLYWEALTSSVREIRHNLRTIALQSTVLVLVTALAVGAVAHVFGYPWPIALALGAVLAPTDAAAVAAVARAMPRRILTVLRTESLLNDGTALVLLAVAIEVVTEDAPFDWTATTLRFVESYAGGIAIGVVVALLLRLVRRRLDDPLLHSVLSVVTPFFAFLPAESLHVSGVLAVVTCGLVSSRYGPRVISPDARVQATAFWEVTSHLLNSALFVLVGTQLPAAVRALTSTALLQAVVVAAAVSAAVLGTRFLWFYTVPYAVRFVDRRPVQKERRIGAAQRLPLAWAGMRGAISLAAALTIPAVTADGRAVEHRDAIVFTTVVVIVVTLTVLGPSLPAVVRRAGYGDDHEQTAESALAHRYLSVAALRELPGLARRYSAAPSTVAHLERDINDRIDTSEDAARRSRSALRLETALLHVKRQALSELRDTGRIDDIVHRSVQDVLDAEDVRLRIKASRAPSGTGCASTAGPPRDDAPVT
ncbi:Na+/H+ antiporter [Streptomyces sp. NPDC102406]|uniref:Na+/H+ antiporter n=1 Tax=Streptomyces sp. NPDC102406 TaxID=3366171 RepID=UPI0037F82BEE